MQMTSVDWSFQSGFEKTIALGFFVNFRTLARDTKRQGRLCMLKPFDIVFAPVQPIITMRRASRRPVYSVETGCAISQRSCKRGVCRRQRFVGVLVICPHSLAQTHPGSTLHMSGLTHTIFLPSPCKGQGTRPQQRTEARLVSFSSVSSMLQTLGLLMLATAGVKIYANPLITAPPCLQV